jgi:hypothetical protein
VSVPLFPFVIVLLLFIAGVFSAYSKRNKIFCWFEGEDGTDEFRWVTNKDGFVIFRGKKYDIITDRITNLWIKSGIHMLFPTRVACLKYSWYSRFPHDPSNYGRTIISPNVRKVIDKSELVASYFKTSTPASGKKEGAIMRWLPLIAIGLIIIVGYYAYSNMNELADGLNKLQQNFNTIAPK